MLYHSDDPVAPAFIDTATHFLTGAQVLFHLFHTWEVEPNRPVTLWSLRGEGIAKMKVIRVALSKERNERKTYRTFELRFSEPYPYTFRGIKGEAMRVVRVAGTMQTRINAAFVQLKEGR